MSGKDLALAKINSYFSHKAPNGQTTLKYLAELVIVNHGNSNVTQMGVVKATNENPFKRVGLTVEEGFHLTQMMNFLKGILFAFDQPDLEIDVMQFVLREIEMVKSGSKIYVPTADELSKFK
jgi:hypothetical protein